MRPTALEHGASFPLAATASLHECCAGGVLKHLANAFTRLGRALEVPHCTNLLCDRHTLLGTNRSLRSLAELIDNLGIVTQVLLAPNQDDGQVLAKVKYFRDPLLLNIVERVGRVDSEADENDVRVRVGKGTETIVVFLAGGIPESEFDVTAIDLDVGNVVLKNGGDVNFREGALLEWQTEGHVECRCGR